ncbi:MAG: sugar transferase [Simkaniaceae bacterium]|nr:sugar transferase [Simkaniaceae bacterium]
MFFSTIILIFGSPIFCLIALGVKLTSKGPIFYRSLRVKQGGALFACLKFRSMYVDADERLQELVRRDPNAKAEWQTFLKLKKDPRVTPVGRFLRKTSLDELPQFFNVLLGDLSVVGPRPYAVMNGIKNYQAEIRQYLGPDLEKVLSVKPGITGLWQTSGRNELSLKDRVRLDIEYIARCSFLYDLRLIAKTIPVMIFAKGAY